MEYIEVVNEYGVSEGLILSRDDVHRQGLWHKGFIGVVVNGNDEILMQQRSSAKEKFPGLWDLSGAGHVIAGEDSFVALIRELSEEIGTYVERNVSAKKCRYLESFKNEHVYYDPKLQQEVHERVWYDFYLIRHDQDISEFTFNDDEVQNVKWMSIYDIIKLEKQDVLHPRKEWISIVQRYLNILQ